MKSFTFTKSNPRDCSGHNTAIVRDSSYNRYIKFGVDGWCAFMSMKYSKVCTLLNSDGFKRAEKDGAKIWNSLIKNRLDGRDLIRLLRYKRMLLHRRNMQTAKPTPYSFLYETPIKPLLKWPGGKSSEFKHIRDTYPDLLPTSVKRYFEPFAGGMAVGLAMNVDELFINDLCPDLIKFYELVSDEDASFYSIFELMTAKWNELQKIAEKHAHDIYKMSDEQLEKVLVPYRKSLEANHFAPQYKSTFVDTLTETLISKIANIHRAEGKRNQILPSDDIPSNVEGAFKAGFYTHVRDIYNAHTNMDDVKAATFYFLREYCFSSMFRYNADGEFNVPYGGLTYNDKSPDSRVAHWRNPRTVAHMRRANFECMDFLAFLRKHKPTAGDFIFLDPPYDTEFSTYAQNAFGKAEQESLAKYLLTECKANFMAVMKATPFIQSLYEKKDPNIRCDYFDKSYMVSFMDRNAKDVQHVIVTRIV